MIKKNQLIGFAILALFIFGLTIFPILVKIRMNSNEIFSRPYNGVIKEIYSNEKIIQFFLNNNTEFDCGMDDLDLKDIVAINDSIYKNENSYKFYFYRKDSLNKQYKLILVREITRPI